MLFSPYEKERMIYYYSKGMKAPTIRKKMLIEEIFASREGIHKFLSRVAESGSMLWQAGSGRSSKITAEIRKSMDDQMELDDETTAHQLHSLLVQKGYNISLKTILRCRRSLGWTFRGSAYCQLIRDVHKQKRLDWALLYKVDEFLDEIYTDECTVQMESHMRHCCRKKNRAPRLKPRPKHPTKVHIWAGISKRGRSGICIFDGIMNRFLYIEILGKTLLPFLEDMYPHSHRLMADNDPKHTSNDAINYLKNNGVNWWHTPAESPDLNPIKNLWHELKEYICREV
uniref:Tc1-like transposase DDE domain-containing protein n=1 Tax=Amphimedon queenslandica TaxID=400682 RepID=A0A1X7VW02_AMPQE